MLIASFNVTQNNTSMLLFRGRYQTNTDWFKTSQCYSSKCRIYSSGKLSA